MPADTARDCTVTMLDGTSFNVSIKPKLLVSELVEMACSHCKINTDERKYFGLKISHGSYDCWLEPEKPVLDASHDLPKPPHPLILNLAILFFVEDYRLLTDHITVEQYYFQAKQAVCDNKLQCKNQHLFTLIGCILQEMHGNYRNDKEAIENFKALMTLPAKLHKELGLPTCEKEVLHYYRNLRGHSRGDAIVRFLETVQSLPMYGVHYFNVKDKKECPKWLGIGLEGVMQFNHEDKQSCTRKWSWKQLKNIMYKEKKFIMEIIDSNPHSQIKHTISSPGSIMDHVGSKKPQTPAGSETVNTHTWYSTPKVVLALWRMAKVQHKFSKGRSTSGEALDPAELIKRLNTLLVAPSNLRRSPSESQNSISSSGSSNPISAQAQEVAKSAQSHMYTALTAKRNVLIEQLEAKVRRYKELQLKEMQITRIPPEGLSEDMISSLVNKTPNQFKFSPLVLENGDLGSDINQLEKQIEVQSAIVKANKRLVSESSDGRLKKTRKKDLKKQEEKLKDLEARLAEMKGRGIAHQSNFFIGPPQNMRHTGGVTGDIIPRSAPPTRKGFLAPRGTVDDSVISDLIFETRETPQMMRKTQTLNKSTPNLNKSSPNLSDLSFSPTPPIHRRDQFGSSVSSISSKTKSIGSLPSHSDADTHSLSRDKSHSPVSEEFSPTSSIPAPHLSPSATLYGFGRPVSPSRPAPVGLSPSKSSIKQGGANPANAMTTSDMFADFIDEQKDRRNVSGPSPVPNSCGSPQAGRKKIHHYESIWDYPPSVPENDYSKRESNDKLMSRHDQSRYDQHMSRQNQQVSRQEQQMSRYDHHILRHDQMSRQEFQMPRMDHQMSRNDLPVSRQNHLMTRQELFTKQVPRPDPYMSRQQQDFMGHHLIQEHLHPPPLPSRSYSNMLPQQHNQFYPDDRLGYSDPGSSNTLERRRRKYSQPADPINIMSNGYPPGRQPKPSVEQDLFSSSYHYQMSGNNGTLTRPANKYDQGRYDQMNCDFAPSSLPYGVMQQHPRQRSEPEYLFEHAKSDIVDYQYHRVNNSNATTSTSSMTNNKYLEQNSNSYSFHDPGTFEEGTLV